MDQFSLMKERTRIQVQQKPNGNMRSKNHVRPTQSPPALRQDNAPPPSLFDELMVEILSWLPVKSLVRFRCVCKSWKSFISDPNFVKLHLQKSPKNANLILKSKGFARKRFAQSYSICPLLENPSSTIITEDLCSRLDLEKNYEFVGSCNGLVCLAGEFCRDVFEEICVCFWNPATRLRSQKSPFLLVDSGSHPYSYTLFGFGYDNLTDNYKVVVVLLDMEPKEDSKVKVYSLGDNCWRNIQSFPTVQSVTHDNGVYLSGTLNWLAVPNFNSYKQLVIVSLDLGKETYRQSLLPCGLDEVDVELTLGILMDCLCLSHDYKRTHFVVWQMKELGVEKSWTQLVNVSYQDLRIGCVQYASVLPLCMYENGDILMMVAYSKELQAILYNLRGSKVERIQISNNIRWIYAMDYVQSLVSPP